MVMKKKNSAKPAKGKLKPKKVASKGSKTAGLVPLKAISKKQTKSAILKAIAEHTGLSAKEVQAVFLNASQLAKCHLIKNGSGEFVIPEMAIKVSRKTKPATKKREGRNPFTGETIMIAAKPKREVIRLKPMKALKEILL